MYKIHIHIHFSHQDCVILDWLRQFTASQPFQCLVVSIMNGFTRLRYGFIIHNHHRTTTFELWVVKISAQVPYYSHQDCVFLD